MNNAHITSHKIHMHTCVCACVRLVYIINLFIFTIFFGGFFHLTPADYVRGSISVCWLLRHSVQNVNFVSMSFCCCNTHRTTVIKSKNSQSYWYDSVEELREREKNRQQTQSPNYARTDCFLYGCFSHWEWLLLVLLFLLSSWVHRQFTFCDNRNQATTTTKWRGKKTQEIRTNKNSEKKSKKMKYTVHTTTKNYTLADTYTLTLVFLYSCNVNSMKYIREGNIRRPFKVIKRFCVIHVQLCVRFIFVVAMVDFVVLIPKKYNKNTEREREK